MNGRKTVVGMDLAKRVFQLHWMDMETGAIVSLQLKREKFLEQLGQPVVVPDGHGCMRRSAALGETVDGDGSPGQALTRQGRQRLRHRPQQ